MAIDSSRGELKAPPAQRFTAPSWRDFRLWLGLILVAGSVLVGSAVLNRSDNSVLVWAASRSLNVGQAVSADDLEARKVSVSDRAALAPYFTGSQRLPTDATLVKEVKAGEWLPRSALGSRSGAGLDQLPLAVDPNRLPPNLVTGSVVDVWVALSRGRRAELLFADVPVLGVSATSELDSTATRQVIIGLDGQAAATLAEALALTERGTVTLVVKA